MKSYWVRVSSKSNDFCAYKKSIRKHRQTGRMLVTRGRAKEHQGHLEERRKEVSSYPRAFRESMTLLDSWPLASKTMKYCFYHVLKCIFLFFQVTQFVVICYDNPGKLINALTPSGWPSVDQNKVWGFYKGHSGLLSSVLQYCWNSCSGL